MKEETQIKNKEKAVRIRQIRDYFCFGNNTEFAKKLGVNTNQSSALCCGKQSVGLESIEKVLAAFPDVSRRWLLTGEGSMFAQVGVGEAVASESQQSSDPDLAIMAAKDAQIDALKAQAAAMQRTIDTQEAYIGRLEKILKDYEE